MKKLLVNSLFFGALFEALFVGRIAGVLAATPFENSPFLTAADLAPEGLAPSDWESIRAAYEAGRHAFRPAKSGWQAQNPGQRWTTTFDQRGFLAQPRDASWQWGLALQSYGFGDQQTIIAGRPAVTADGARLSYAWTSNLQEWFVNDSRGLEHGFTLATRPVPNASADLSFMLATRGGLRPVISGDARDVVFQNESGVNLLTYSGLKVWDADGRQLPARFELVGADSLRLLVDERSARYPLTIDPIAQQAYIKASNPGEEDQFGIAVAISGDTVAVGANFEDSSAVGVKVQPNDDLRDAGAVYIFVRSGGGWTQQAYLKAGNPGLFDEFGVSVSLSGDTLVVGAPYEDSKSTGVNSTPNDEINDSGAAYVFVRSGSTWTQQAYLKASNSGPGDLFGGSVSISSNTIVVGARRESSGTTGSNSTPNEDGTESGAAYVFVRNGNSWSQQAYLKASNTGDGDSFGAAVAVAGDTVVIGAPNEDSDSRGVNGASNDEAIRSGAAYVFARTGTQWSQQAFLKASNTGVEDRFGAAVAVAGETIVVGAPDEGSSTTGINSEPNEDAEESGAAYVFVRTGGTWSQQAYLKASNTGSGEQFGNSVSMSGETLAVAARWETSSSTGINSEPSGYDTDAGAVYVFVRNGTLWSQQAYLKASNTDDVDNFGASVSVSDGTVVVGAPLEDSASSGVNRAPNEEATDAGALYVFTGFGPVTVSPPATIAIMPVAPGTIERRFRVTGVPGRTYQLEIAKLVSGPWEKVLGAGGKGATAANGVKELVDAKPVSGNVFYRVIEQ